MGVGTKVFLTIFGLVFLGAGVAVLVAMLHDLGQTADTYAWKETPCRILSSGVHEKTRTDRPYRFVVRYTYEVDGKPHASDVYMRDYRGTDDYGEALRAAHRYAPGAEATCYVDPSDPTRAVLAHETAWKGFMLLFPVPFIAVGGGILYALWRPRKKRPDGSAAPEPISADAKKGGASRWLLVFFAVFFVAGVVATYFAFIRPWQRIQDAKGWAETPCRVQDAWLEEHTGEDSTTYSIEVLFAYKYDGKDYKSSWYSFAGGSSSGYGGKKAVVDRLLREQQTVCFVNPDDPYEAVLHREFTPGMWLGLIPVVFALVGGIGGFFTLRSIVRRRVLGAPLSGVQAKPAPSAGMPQARVATGPVLLEPKTSPVTKLVIIAGVAAVWNGIVLAVLLTQFVWFILIFAAIGVVLAGAVIYQLLACFNPRPRLTVSTDAPRLGGAVELRWDVSGRTERIEKLTITLEGREEATYQRGTNTYTDRSTFARVTLAELSDPRDMLTGDTTFTVPADTMHSFAADNNKIVWRLRVHGDIRHWPNVNDEFPFTILPADTRQ